MAQSVNVLDDIQHIIDDIRVLLKHKLENNDNNINNDNNDNDSGIIVRPFRGYHPPSELMNDVASPPYDVINTEEAREACKGNAKSFLNVNKPQIQFEKGFDQYDDKVYEMGRTQIEKFCKEKWLVQDDKPSLYIYSQRMGAHEQFGIVCESSAVQYEEGLIKKHELTRKKKEDDRTKLTDIQSANVGPIFLCYKKVKEIDDKIAEFVTKNVAFSDFTSSDGIQHKLWIINDKRMIDDIQCLFQQRVKCSYVADGHHRTASAWRVYKQRRAELEKLGKYRGDEPFHYFLSVLFPDDQLKILDYNRICDDFGTKYGNDRDGFLKEISKNWIYKKLNDEISSNDDLLKPNRSKEFRMYICSDGWYQLKPKGNIIKAVGDDPVKSLDVSILSEYLLDPIMGIKNLRTDPNISFMGGIHGFNALKKKIDEKGGGVAFGLYPTTINQLISVADAQKLMPPKSTWFEPKLRSGVVVRRF